MAAHRLGLGTQGGQATFAILLFQDLAVIPMLAVLPLLGTSGGWSGFSWQGVGFAVAVIVGTLVLGHFIARPVFRHIARTRLREIFTAFALLLVLGIALLFEAAGLSMALGAFLAGVLLAESEYRHEIEAAIEPFKGLLLGLFFISVGMSVDFSVLLDRPGLIAAFIVGLFVLKSIVLWVIAARAQLPASERPLFIVLLAQGGEFAFVILGLAAAGGDSADLLVIALDERESITRLARVARAHFPKLRIIARAHDMRHMFELRDMEVEMIERETWLAALKLGETALAVATQDTERAQRAARAFAEHDHVVQAKLYAVHKSAPDAHITVSNELRDQLKRTLREDDSEVRGKLAP